MNNLHQVRIKLKQLLATMYREARDWVSPLRTVFPKLSEVSSEEKRFYGEYSGRALVLFIVWSVVLISAAALAYRTITTATTNAELLELIDRLWPYLLALLTPLLHYYFGSRRRNGDEDSEEKDEAEEDQFLN
jgi:hypothetical protein